MKIKLLALCAFIVIGVLLIACATPTPTHSQRNRRRAATANGCGATNRYRSTDQGARPNQTPSAGRRSESDRSGVQVEFTLERLGRRSRTQHVLCALSLAAQLGPQSRGRSCAELYGVQVPL